MSAVVHIENPEERVLDKFIRKAKEEPWIPVGTRTSSRPATADRPPCVSQAVS